MSDPGRRDERAPAFRFLLIRRYSRYTLHAWRRLVGWAFDLLHRKSRFTLWVYGRDNDNPTAGCQITVRQDGIGYVDSAQGKDFYEALRAGGLDKLFETGATALRADVRAGHFRLMRHQLREQATVTQIGQAKAGHVELVTVEIRRLS